MDFRILLQNQQRHQEMFLQTAWSNIEAIYRSFYYVLLNSGTRSHTSRQRKDESFIRWRRAAPLQESKLGANDSR